MNWKKVVLFLIAVILVLLVLAAVDLFLLMINPASAQTTVVRAQIGDHGRTLSSEEIILILQHCHGWCSTDSVSWFFTLSTSP